MASCYVLHHIFWLHVNGPLQESKVRFDSDQEFKKQAHATVVSLQSHDPNVLRAWELICDVSRKGRAGGRGSASSVRVECSNLHTLFCSEFQKIYSRLGVTIIERGESVYQPMMSKVVADLEEKSESSWSCKQICLDHDLSVSVME